MSEICPICGLPKELCMCEEIAREQQSVRISIDSRRYGKTVTVIDGIDGNDIDIADLAKTLKSRCAEPARTDASNSRATTRRRSKPYWRRWDSAPK